MRTNQNLGEEKKPNPEKELKDKIKQALLNSVNARDSEEIEFLLKRL